MVMHIGCWYVFCKHLAGKVMLLTYYVSLLKLATYVLLLKGDIKMRLLRTLRPLTNLLTN